MLESTFKSGCGVYDVDRRAGDDLNLRELGHARSVDIARLALVHPLVRLAHRRLEYARLTELRTRCDLLFDTGIVHFCPIKQPDQKGCIEGISTKYA